ncbi:MAG: hypothetical protein JST92_05740 [Deltaproteobacteria bacterium]|nr:hypothetical protein [Deltaproteobacteria bacterium]
MSSSERTLPLAILLACLAGLAACTSDVPATFAPQPARMVPSGGRIDVEHAVVIQGAHFYASGQHTLSAHGGIVVDEGYSASLDGVALTSVVRVSDTQLSAVVPAGLANGAHDLRVVGPYQLEGTLAHAWVASDLSLAQLTTVFAPAAQVSTGQAIPLSLHVSNSGGADALGVTVALAQSGSGAFAALPALALQDIAGGRSKTFAEQVTAAQAGAVTLTATAAGSDGVSGEDVAAPLVTAQVLIQRHSALQVTTVAPAVQRVNLGAPLAFSLTVTNTGEAKARAVSFSAPVITGTATLRPASSPSAQDLAGGAAGTFTWTYDTTGPGEATLSVEAGSGTDDNDQLPVVAPAASWPAVTVQTPGALSAALAALPAQVSAGQTITARLTVTNGGTAEVHAVTPALRQSGAGQFTVAAAPSAVELAGGASADFVWTLTAASAGTAALAFSASGTDDNSGATVSTADVPASVLIQTPAQLGASAIAAPAQVSTGQTFTLSLEVTNAGEAAALGVLPGTPLETGPALRTLSTPVAQDVPGGATRTFTWTFASDVAGTSTLAEAAAGTDANSGSTISSATATSNAVTIANAATLQASAALDRAQVSVGQTVTLTLTLHDAGQAGVTGASCATPTLTGSGGLTLTSSPATQDVPGGATRTCVWTYVAASAGTSTFSSSASGSDQNSGAAVASNAASAGPLLIQTAAALTAQASLAPPNASTGQLMSFQLEVTNTGQATASLVAPGPVAHAGTGTATQVAAPSAQDVPGGETRTFTWGYSATAAGGVQLSASVSGTDANSGLTVQAGPASASASIATAPTLTGVARLSQAQVSAGQELQLLLDVTNPSQVDVLRFAPDAPASSSSLTVIAASPTAADVPAGATVTFSWTLTAQAPGTQSFTLTGVGLDANSGFTITMPAASSPTLTIQSAASLSASARLSTTQVSAGQSFQVFLDVADAGAASVLSAAGSVTPTGSAGVQLDSAPAAQTIAGASTSTFTWTFHALSTGSVVFALAVTGSDANSGASIGANATSPPLLVQAPAALTASVLAAPSTANVGQPVTLSLTITNTGEATASAVTPGAPLLSPANAATLSSGPSPASASIAGGSAQTFTWTYVAATVGPATIAANAGGVDLNSGQAVSASAQTTVLVQRAAALSASWTAPTDVEVGQAFTLLLTVTDAGDAAANMVTPGTVGVTGPGAASKDTGPTPPSASIAGGTSATFSWQFTATSSGDVTFAASASGLDATSGSAVASSSVPVTITVRTAAVFSASASVTPARVDVGQDVTFALHVSNGGSTTALNVTPSTPTLTGGATLAPLTSPSATDIAGGASHDFIWTYTATGAGTLVLSAGATGTDATTASPVTATPASSVLVVQTPAALSASLSAAQTIVNLGGAIALSLAVTNMGGATASTTTPTALSVTPPGRATLLTGPSPARVDLAGGAQQTFAWSMQANSLGTVTVSGGATAFDANTGQALAASSTSPVSVLVQSPAALAATFTVPFTVNVGQAFSVTLQAANTGDTAASSSHPLVPTLSGTASAALLGGPAPATATIAGHGNQTFAFAYSASSAGTLRFATNVAGVDAIDGAAVTSTLVQSSTVSVQTPSALSATLSVPSKIVLGDSFQASLTVNNTGDGTISAFTLHAPTIVSGSTGAATLTSGPSPSAPSVLAGHTSQVFAWTFTSTLDGTLQLSAQVTGTDVNDSSARSVTATSGVATIGEAIVVASDPFGDQTAFSFLLGYQSQLWLGPDKLGTGAVAMNADGSGAQTVPWQFERPANASNTFYASTPAHTLGYKGCSPNSASCGPDNESGRALFFTGTIGGTDWLGAAGAHVNSGSDYSRFVYLTNPSFPLASGGYTDFAYVDLSGSLDLSSSTDALTSAAVFENRMYFGFHDASALTPVLLGLTQMPSLPGFAPGNALVDLGATNMPGVGGGPMIDSMAVFGTAPDDQLYLANRAGFTRSTSATPGRCDLLLVVLLCPDWTDVTPSATAYRSKNSLSTSKTSDLEPADRAVPAMASFGGHLFAARNTTNGPQLWSCDPSASGSSTQCDSGDWTLLAHNTIGDTKASQFNDPNNTSVTLLVSTPTHLYVGFNNATRGLVLYRTSNPAAVNPGDFSGHRGCAATGSSCAGLGGDGLGAGLTHLFDGKALDFAGSDYLYVAAGTGSSAVQVFRVQP